MLSGCMQGVKMEFTIFSKIWDPYRHVWEIDREDTINVFLKKKPQLKDFENELHKYNMSKSQLTTEKPEYRYGSIMIDCKNLKETIGELVIRLLNLNIHNINSLDQRNFSISSAEYDFIGR